MKSALLGFFTCWQRLAVWLVRDCGLFTYQVTAKFGAGYYAPKTTETLINYTACWAKYYSTIPNPSSSISISSSIIIILSPLINLSSTDALAQSLNDSNSSFKLISIGIVI